MSESLDKARAAIEAAKDHEVGSLPYEDLLKIANTHARIASAHALERIAKRLDLGLPV